MVMSGWKGGEGREERERDREREREREREGGRNISHRYLLTTTLKKIFVM